MTSNEIYVIIFLLNSGSVRLSVCHFFVCPPVCLFICLSLFCSFTCLSVFLFAPFYSSTYSLIEMVGPFSPSYKYYFIPEGQAKGKRSLLICEFVSIIVFLHFLILSLSINFMKIYEDQKSQNANF